MITTTAAYAVTVIVLAGCCAYAYSAQGGHDGRVGAVVVRARWAWRCRGKPVPADGERLTRAEIQVLGNLDAGRDVRSRT